MTSPFATAKAARDYALAGSATLTVVSKATGARFTYRIRKGKEDAPWFVQVLSGPMNTEDFTYLGCIFITEPECFRHGKKSSIQRSAPSSQAFRWAWAQLWNPSNEIHPSLEIWHEGRCGRCGRALTTPESIETGIGPVCASKVAA